MVQRSNPLPPHGHGSAIVLPPSPHCGVVGVWCCPPPPLWCGGRVDIYIYVYTYLFICLFIFYMYIKLMC